MPEDEEITRSPRLLPLTREERLTAQFYDWERRGRGWQLWSYPVELEPPFRPFFGHYVDFWPPSMMPASLPFSVRLLTAFLGVAPPRSTYAARGRT